MVAAHGEEVLIIRDWELGARVTAFELSYG